MRPRSDRLLVVILVSVCLATITVDYRQGNNGPLASLGSAAHTIMEPLQRGVTAVSRPIGNFLSGLAHVGSLKAKNDSLTQQLIAAEEQVRAEQQQAQTMGHLLALLKLKKALSPPSTAALVIGYGVSNLQWSVTLNVGSSQGIAIDDPVVTDGDPSVGAKGVLVGHVVSVSMDSCEVQLLIDPGSSVAARLLGGPSGLLVGAGDEDPKMTLVDPSANVSAGQTVVTSGYQTALGHGLYPPGIAIGEVSRVLPAPTQLQRYITVRPAADLSSLDLVLVIRTGGGG